MASSKLVRLSSVFIRSYRSTSISSSSHLLFPIATFSPVSRAQPSLRFCTAASAVDSSTATFSDEEPLAASVGGTHPWPEWDSFLEKLNSKGFFEKTTSTTGENEASSIVEEDVFTDTNRVKNACLKFARERYDILSILPKQDMKAMVDTRCPNLYRKSINSSKRLRAFLNIIESDACGVCKLRSSCDKAYTEHKGEEYARTVDIIRIILSYALEPNNLSGNENKNDNFVKENIQECARNLLSELIRLSDTIIDPSIPKPVFESAAKLKKVKVPRSKERETRDLNANVEMKKGDWMCPSCNVLNFARNRICFRCSEDGPKKVDLGDIEMKPGDWTCKKCEFMNFARNKECFRCEEPHKRDLQYGEWQCPDCNYVNFRRNVACKKCNREVPPQGRAATGGNQLDLWESPKLIQKKKNSFKFTNESDGGIEIENERKGSGDSSSSRFEGYRKLSSEKRDSNSKRKPAYTRD